MREIKFRAFGFGSMIYFKKPEDLKWFFGGDSGAERTLTECNLMQYTGLKDKNGVEIYEGDVVTCVVMQDWNIPEMWNYDNTAKEVVINDITKTIWQIADFPKSFEIIGNIYQEEYKHLRGE